jgi:RNA polymerase sigma factor (sigma-70 family)
VEASALPASVGLARTRIGIAAPLLRLRSDEQLVTLFRAGNEDAFRAIHDRYRTRMLAYTRQMLTGSPQDPEDAVQEVFVRAYAGLRANHRELALRAWLYRIAHNRCVDELRRAHPPVLEAIDARMPATHDPLAKVEERDSLRRLIADVQRLPEQQRSALLMRELGGMAYTDVGGALGVSVAAVKSLLVRARIGLAQASEARDTACAEIREDVISSHDRGVRTSGLARRHMRDCSSCRQFRCEVRGVSRRFAALTPTLGPLGVVANLLGWGSGGGAAGGAVAGGGAAAAGSGAAASAGALAGGAGHVVTLLAAAIVATGGAVELQHSLAAPGAHRAHHHRIVTSPRASATPQAPSEPTPAAISGPSSTPAQSSPAAPAPPSVSNSRAARPAPIHHTVTSTWGGGSAAGHRAPTSTLPISETLDPDSMTAASTPSATAPGTVGSNPAAPDGSTTGTPPAAGSNTGSPTAGTSTDPGTPSGATGAATGTPAAGTTGAPGTTTGGSSSGTGTPGTSTGSGTAGSSSGGSAATSPTVGASSPPTGATKLSTFVSPGQ